MIEIKAFLNQLVWYEYTIAGLGVFLLIFMISNTLARRKLRLLKKQALADHIDLQESGKKEKWFRVFSEAAPQVFWIRNQIKTLYVSPFFEDLIEHPDRIAYKEFPWLQTLAHPDEVDHLQNQYTQFFESGSNTLDHTFRIRRPNGSYKWIRERVFNFKDISGEAFMVGLLEDETKKQQSIEDLRNNQLLVNNILDSSDEGIFVLDQNYQPIYWNREMEQISGIAAARIFDGRKIWDHFPHLIENGAAAVIQLTMSGEPLPVDDYNYALPNGRKGITREKYLPLLNSRQEITGVIGFIMDITEEMARESILEKTQERYALTLQAVNDGIWDWNLKENTIIFSDQWFTMLGYAYNDLAPSMQTLTSLIYPSDYKRFQNQAQEAFNSHHALDLEIRMKHKSGAWLWMMIRGKCIEYDDSGKAIRAIGTQTDINQRKTYELHLIEAKEKAEESDRLKSSFLSLVSHEIRTPMNAIIGFSDLVIDGNNSPEEMSQYRLQIRQNADKLVQLITDIIDLAKMESGQYEVHKEEVDLINLLKVTARSFHSKSPHDNKDKIALKLKIPTQLKELHLETDPKLIQQVIHQLLSNAYKFTSSGNVDLGLLPPAENEISLFVKDTGIGIAEADLERIFNRFEQVDHSLTRKYGGTGMGLTLVKQIVNLLDGQIRVESQPGVGSNFIIILPGNQA